MAVIERIRGSERIQRIIRKEGEMRVAPSDAQCCAVNTKGNRCKKDIWHDGESDTWSTMCEAHSEQNEKARHGDAKKVKVFQ